MIADDADQSLPARGAEAIQQAFDTFQRAFREITRRAPARQEQCDWQGMQRDAVERLDLYERMVRQVVADVRQLLGDQLHNQALWVQVKRVYSHLVARRPDCELAQTFFNSITRRVFTTVGVNRDIEFVDSDFDRPLAQAGDSPYSTYVRRGTVHELIRDILADRPLTVAYKDLDSDARLVADRIEAHRQAAWAGQGIELIDVLKPVFYRNKGAYLIGRIRGGSHVMPLVIALINEHRKIVVDAVLLTEDEASIVFSFTRAYFHVDMDAPRDVIHFLTSLMPVKRIAELYTALGYNKHGKAELYRHLMHHLARSSDKFEIAPGDRGMVMLVFAMPSYDIVFKVIRDRFAHPKTITRPEVMGRYQLVFRHDRAGRLVDAQAFEHLAFPKDRFSASLLAELMETAASNVIVEDSRVVIAHLYAERRVTPLNLYLRDVAGAAARDAVLDYGQAIKDLAATNIFPGDLLLKNFGVTRHGRVIFYDYDELCLLTDCNFRHMPQARDFDDEMALEPWFHVGPSDMFPEEFITFMGLHGDLRHAFLKVHGDLLGPEFWTKMQALHRAGEIVDIFPYRPSRRLHVAGPS